MGHHSRVFRILLLCVVVVGLCVRSAPARADDEASTADARAAFLEGAKLVEEARWADALQRFERSALLRPHPVTTYNVAACLRALGAYTHAKRRYAEALRASGEAGGAEELSAQVRVEIEGLLVQLDSIVAQVDVTLEPVPAQLLIDGRPLLFEAPGVALAGVRAPGPAETVTSSRFVVSIDPGVHTITVRREGYGDAVATLTSLPGSRAQQVLQLDRLPSTLRIASTPGQGVVRVDDVDVGTAPIVLTRPPGAHRVVIVKPGFVTYDSRFSTHPGEDLRITGNLTAEKPSLTKRWWFWASLGAALITVGAVSYAVVRSTQEPEQAPFDGGTLGWTVPAR